VHEREITCARHGIDVDVREQGGIKLRVQRRSETVRFERTTGSSGQQLAAGERQGVDWPGMTVNLTWVVYVLQ